MVAINKSGVQAQIATAAFETMIEATVPYCVKILDGARDLPTVNTWANRRRSMGGGLLVLRTVTGDGVRIADMPTLTARTLRDFAGWAALATGGVNVVLEVPINEKFHTDPAEFAALAEATDVFVEAATDAGFWAGVLVTSEGNPPGDNYGAGYFTQPRVLAMLRKWRQLPKRKPGKRVVWVPHGYSHPPTPANDVWHFDRPAHILAQLPEDARLNYAFGEMGCDGGCDLPDKKPGVGYTGYFAPEDGRVRRYAAWVRPQVATMAADPLCIGGAFFLSGADPSGDPNFTTFDVRDEVDFRPVLTESVPGPPITWLEPVGVPPVPETRGIDISNNNGYVDLAQVKAAGYRFVAIKASQDTPGGGFRDLYFADNWRRAGELELGRLVYHMTDARYASPAQSVTLVQEMVDGVGGLKPGDAVALDAELGPLPTAWFAEALALASDVFGHLVRKYSGRWYTLQQGLEIDAYARYPTWFVGQPGDVEPVGWRPVDMWQTTLPAGSVPGVTGACDVNTFLGTLEELRAKGRPAPPDADWETPVFGPIYRGASAVGAMPDKTADDESDAVLCIQAMDRMKARHAG